VQFLAPAENGPSCFQAFARPYNKATKMTAAFEERPSAQELPPGLELGKRKRVVIIGGGFAGIAAARALRHCNAEVVLIDRRNHHIFQPLLYQVATAVLAPADIAAPIRQLGEKQKNLTVMLAEVAAIDLNSRLVNVSFPTSGSHKVAFDFLVVAAGMQPSYFGHDEFAKFAPALKNLRDAETIRTKILSAYELAELTDDDNERARLMTFVLVGGGATGVELAGSLAHIAKVTLRRNYRHIDPTKTSIILIEGGNRILPSLAEALSGKAARRLEKLGITILTGTKVEKVDEQGVVAGALRIPSATVLWTAGVAVSAVVKTLGVQTDRAGRLPVDPFLMVQGVRDVFAAGDVTALSQDGRPLPGVAQVAIQQGRYVGRQISLQLNGKAARRPFRYFDKGNMAVVGKGFAVLERGRIRTSGFATWGVWVLIHVIFLPQLQNRLRVQRQWFWSYWTGQRSSRVIDEQPRGQ
jgi:NADH:ubiquinone reductase (H+-translocating)